ncbi:MAG: type III polyketide synthase [Phycisphaerae bacterium]|nr:type III polyketide synthase [Phycisphaerae bacterium]
MFIQQVGCAVPLHPISQADWLDVVRVAYADERTQTLLRRLIRNTGIDRRHLAALGFQLRSDAPPMFRPYAEQPSGPGFGDRSRAFDVAAPALVQQAVAALDPAAVARVDALITVSCTHASSPGIELGLLQHAQVPRAAQRWNLGFMGCSAGLAGVRLAHSIRQQHPSVLLVTCELSSLHFQYHSELDQMTANALFADGAAAVLLGSEPSAVRVAGARCVSLPEAADQMVWFADDCGLRLRLSPELPDTLAHHLPGVLAAFLDSCNVRRAEINHWMVHPGGPRILDSVEQALALPREALAASRDVLRRFGNMSSSTIHFILDQVRRESPRGYGVAVAFGPGLTIELVLLEFRSA